MSTNAPAAPTGLPPLRDARIAIIAARFNQHLTDRMVTQTLERLAERGVPVEPKVDVHRVPGAFELPLAARLAIDTEQYDAIICLGCVIRGDTPHFDYVAGECARGVQQVALATGVPVIFGVLTTNTEQQALDRVDGTHSRAGHNAADAAVEMVHLARALGNR
jgi:6,7-dimethyl-8-ribityllumazine synthase